MRNDHFTIHSRDGGGGIAHKGDGKGGGRGGKKLEGQVLRNGEAKRAHDDANQAIP
jgi:hypothetical protein